MNFLYLITKNIRCENNYSLKNFIESDYTNKIIMFCFSEEFFANEKQKNFLLYKLKKLKEKLENINVNINICSGDVKKNLSYMFENFKIDKLFYSKTYDLIEKNIFEIASKYKIKQNSINDNFLIEHDKIDVKKEIFSFSYFKKFLLEEKLISIKEQQSITHSRGNYLLIEKNENEKINNLLSKLIISKQEQTTEKKLEEFKKRSSNYNIERDNFNYDTSLLSADISIGSISVHEIYQNIENQSFRDQILWREYAAHNFYKFPNLLNKNQFKKMDNFPWENNSNLLEKWEKGQTGYDIVDACMNQLNNTGYISNRGRLIVSSFLTKNLFIHWKYGEQYFKQKLIDYDQFNNTLGWQWVSNCGFHFSIMRVISCERQKERFDPNKSFKWYSKFDNKIKKIVDIKETSKKFKDIYYSIK